MVYEDWLSKWDPVQSIHPLIAFECIAALICCLWLYSLMKTRFGGWPLSNTKFLQVQCILKISRLVTFEENYKYEVSGLLVSQVWTFHLYFPISPFIWTWPLVAMRLFWFEARWSFSSQPSSWRESNPCTLQPRTICAIYLENANFHLGIKALDQ